MKAYEELTGASGREMRFRAPRHDARKLFPQTPPRVRMGSGLHPLRNISVGGLALTCSQEEPYVPTVGDTVRLTLQQSGLAIFESEATVCRREDSFLSSTLAFRFVNAFVEFEKLLSRNAQAQIAANTQNANPNSTLVRAEYRTFCADVLAVLRSYKTILNHTSAVARDAGYAFDPAAATTPANRA